LILLFVIYLQYNIKAGKIMNKQYEYQFNLFFSSVIPIISSDPA